MEIEIALIADRQRRARHRESQQQNWKELIEASCNIRDCRHYVEATCTAQGCDRDGEYECSQCFGRKFYCIECYAEKHRDLPLHVPLRKSKFGPSKATVREEIINCHVECADPQCQRVRSAKIISFPSGMHDITINEYYMRRHDEGISEVLQM